MKILHWDEMFHPSFGYQINVLAKFQAKQGHEVVIVTSDNIENHPAFLGFGNKENIKQEDELYSNNYGIKIIRLPIHGFISSRVIYKKGYIKQINQLNPDVIMCHTNDALSSIRIAQKHNSINIPIVFDNHMLEMASKNPLRWLFRLYFRFFVTPIIRKNDWIIIRTQDDNYVNKCLGIPKKQTPFISFGTDTTLFYPDMKVRKDFREKHGINENDFIVVYTGKLSEAKGGKLLALAFEKKFNAEKNIVFVVVGNTHGEYGREVDELFERSENRIIRFPTQKYIDLAQFYQSSDLSIFPKQCSLSFFDAQACGLPVVSEDNNINIERVSHGNGVTFKSGDYNDLREKVIEFVEMDATAYKDMVENSIRYVTTNFDYKDIAEEYTALLIKERERFLAKKSNKLIS